MLNRLVPGNKTKNYQKAFKMAAKSKMTVKRYKNYCHIDFLPFDIIALNSNVIPHFRLIRVY